MQKTSYKNILYFFFSLCIVLFCLLGSVHFWSFNESFYKSEHDTLLLDGKHISEYIGISDEQLSDLTSFTLNYLNDPDASLDLQMSVNGQMREIFTDDEKAHMVDVQALNLLANKLLAVSFIGMILAVIYFIFDRQALNDFFVFNKRFLMVLGVFLALLAVWIIIDFDSFWNSFHHVFFVGNDLWLLDLRKDILIMIVPPEFFFHLVTRIFITFIVLLGAFNLVIYLFYRKQAR